MEKEIILLDSWKAPEIKMSKDILEVQSQILITAEAITEIESTPSLEQAVLVVKEIKNVMKQVESARKDVKAPFLDFGKMIDAAADDFTKPIASEAKRIEGVIYSYQQKLAEIERKRLAEIAAAEAKRRQEIEEQRKAELAAAKTAKDKIEAEMKAAEATRETIVQQQPKELEEPQKVSGIAKKRIPVFVVTDIMELAKHRPDLVKIEPLTAKINQEILAGMIKCPGLICSIEETSTVR